MLLVLLLFVVVVWLITARDVFRRGLSGKGRVVWLVATLLLPFVVIPVYWAVRPLPRKAPGARPGAAPVQTLADFVPGRALEDEHARELADHAQGDAWRPPRKASRRPSRRLHGAADGRAGSKGRPSLGH